MKIRIRGTEYPFTAPTGLDVIDMIEMQEQTGALGHMITSGELELMAERIEGSVAGVTDKRERVARRMAHPDTMWMVALQIWASMRKAGVQVDGKPISVLAALSVPLTEVEYLREDGDPDDEPDPTRARRLASAGAAGHRQKRTAKTSGPASNVA